MNHLRKNISMDTMLCHNSLSFVTAQLAPQLQGEAIKPLSLQGHNVIRQE